MKKVRIMLLESALFLLHLLMDPFDIFKIQKPQTTGRANKPPLNIHSVTLDNPKRIEFLLQSVLEKNRMHNDIVTNLRTLYITIFVAMAAFLGVSLGIAATAESPISTIFSVTTWVLLISFIVGVFTTLFEWSYERNRVRQVQMWEEMGMYLLIEGDEKQGMDFLRKTIDDISKRPHWEQLILCIFLVLKNICIFTSFTALVIMAVGLLLN
ncbi:MAG: hypothetical protein PHX93_01580 [Candidatus Peribacteraceae bacterium]|jgi:hypothetical protein|nr:hypothetical protein [Candidatus Peribacteraceae bacterium]